MIVRNVRYYYSRAVAQDVAWEHLSDVLHRALGLERLSILRNLETTQEVTKFIVFGIRNVETSEGRFAAIDQIVTAVNAEFEVLIVNMPGHDSPSATSPASGAAPASTV